VSGTFEWRGDLIVHWRDYFDSAQFQAAMAALT
jgi:limonene-1,2-epoxide hydrolase